MTPSIDVEIRADGVRLPGVLGLPPDRTHVVVFAHGSGSSRFSPRNVAVAEAFQDDGLATLLFDLLTDDEAADRRNVFDIDLLASRLLAAVESVASRDDVAGLPTGLFGASTGGGAAIAAAAANADRISSVVSRGGRPDLAGAALSRVQSPTLLIVGERDELVIELNEQAYAQLRCEKELKIVPRATHLFEEPGALEAVARLASDWFHRHLSPR
jgi:pimeloyl-ACP methyl ester carboxylesterase